MIINTFRETEYKNEAEQIISMIHETRTPRERYLAALRTFGRSDGSKIYRLIKKAV